MGDGGGCLEADLANLARNAFKVYGKAAHRNLVEPRRARYARLDDKYRSYIDSFFLAHLDKIENAIEDNAFFLSQVKDTAVFAFSEDETVQDPATWSGCSSTDMDKVQSTLRQVAREWSTEGAEERAQSYGVILEELQQLYPNIEDRHKIRVLVPGCGLGRLPFDLAALGFEAQGNEFSFHMLFTSNLIMNMCDSRNMFRIHPYIHSFSHHRTRDNQIKEVLVPDISPHVLAEHRQMDPTIPEEGLLSMTAGSFDEIYPSKDGSLFNVITTVFFIDTAPNIFQTLKAISDTLVPGGLWINFGPLLWHYEDVATSLDDDDDRSCGFELSLSDLIALIPNFGLELVKRRSDIPTRYTSGSSDAMGGFLYRCEYWVARKL
ncbi:hypothetical protein AWJ20_665 [Sugiyamaella lignohabitans]|uniref:carnosine N-methyltransferase n=1 Tax=Sugiyamaella lignohabitans TaxID=796027 RepID=A0A167D2V9_9ASCO|nr:uncharacterized protein AWJ20_665 [Sugiyamaella lignohabitans]ANB12412.1 hypothetical protein AWJ20_665 [Sugiyamaella lignohabitans]